MKPAESLYVKVDGGAQLHLRHFPGPGHPVFLVHGAIENGRIFYSDNGKGFAPYLQKQGFDVYVLDLRGRGKSLPKVDAQSLHGQHESIVVDLPAASAFIAQRRPDAGQIWGSHSWGGVLQMSTLARNPACRARVRALVHFATKRAISVWSLSRLVRVELGWKVIARAATRLVGYLPAPSMGFGSDVETRESMASSLAWVGSGPWVDPRDGFDYGAAAQQVAWPPSLWLTGTQDRLLGHPKDVKKFMAECGVNESSFIMVGRAHGHQHDYGHITLLTHPDAPSDHFSWVAAWIKEQEGDRVE